MSHRFHIAVPACGLAAFVASFAGEVPSVVGDRAVASAVASAGSSAEETRIAPNDNRQPAGRLVARTLTLNLEIVSGVLRPEAEDGPGVQALAFAEVGHAPQVPGPLIRVRQGTEIRVTVRNPFRDSTVTVFGLLRHPATSDTGVPIPPGESREARFQAGAPGTYYYWATTGNRELEDRQWFESQLSGALIVDAPSVPANDRVFVIGVWDRGGDSTLARPRDPQTLMVINGKSWPHTERFTFTQGDSVRWRWVNPSGDSHPMHLHGFYYHVESEGDGSSERTFSGDERPLVVTNLMLPGRTMRISWVPERPGNWVFHCHFAFHVSEHMMLPSDDTAAVVTAQAARAGAAMPHTMAGLVLGISVRAATGTRSTARATAPARNIRLLVQSAPKRFGPLTGFGYVVQTGATEPRRDSIQIPGPMLLLQRGEPVRVTIVNHLSMPTAVHWHGIEIESYPDGVPGWSGSPGRIAPAIAPSDSFVAEFVPPRAGTFIYHTHAGEMVQMSSGLYGALLVIDPRHPYHPETDKLVLVGGGGPSDSLPQFDFDTPGLVNGSAAPPPMDLRVGTTYRFRFININPDWRIIFSLMSDSALSSRRAVAKDGADLPASQRRMRPAYLVTGPGETADFEFTPTVRGQLRLEVKTMVPGWIIPITVRVR